MPTLQYGQWIVLSCQMNPLHMIESLAQRQLGKISRTLQNLYICFRESKGQNTLVMTFDPNFMGYT